MIPRINQLLPSFQLGFLNPNSFIQKVEGQEGRQSSSTLAKTMVISAMLFGAFMAGTQFHRLNSEDSNTPCVPSDLEKLATTVQKQIVSINGNFEIWKKESAYAPDFTKMNRYLITVEDILNVYQRCLKPSNEEEMIWRENNCISIKGNIVNGRLDGWGYVIPIGGEGIREDGEFKNGWLINGTRSNIGMDFNIVKSIGKFNQGELFEGEVTHTATILEKSFLIEKGTFNANGKLHGSNCNRTTIDDFFTPPVIWSEVGEFVNDGFVRGVKSLIQEKVKEVWEGTFGPYDDPLRYDVAGLVNGTMTTKDDGKVYQVSMENGKIKKIHINQGFFNWLSSFFRRKS